MALEILLEWWREFGLDAGSVAISLIVVSVYYRVHAARVRLDPSYSVHFVNELTRRIWVENVMGNPGKDVMAVQTLRNFIMYGIVMVSTTTFLLVGTLTLTGQAENISRSWHAINLGGSHSPGLWIVKVMCLLAAFLVAFFSYAMSVRLANHVLFMVNIPQEFQTAHEVLSPRQVAYRLNRAGRLIAVGIRAYFFAIPLVFWLFGPVYMLVATVGVIAILAGLDRHPHGF
jgi:uncharacterized membrane protein